MSSSKGGKPAKSGFISRWPKSKKITRAALKHFWGLGLLIFLFAGSLPFLDYAHQDATVADPSEIIPLSLLFIVVGLVLLAIYSLWLKTSGQRLLAAVLATYGLTEGRPAIVSHLEFIRTAVGHGKGTLLIDLIIFLAAGAIAIILRQGEQYLETKKWSNRPLLSAVGFAAVIICLLNSFRLGAYLFGHRHTSFYQPAKTVNLAPQWQAAGPPRDIYYFVFDRYASPQSMQTNFHFDNSQFMNWLKTQGFSVRDNAFSNYQYTAPSVASTLRMDYNTDLQKNLSGNQPLDVLPYKKLIDNSQVSAALRKAGYQIYNVGNWWSLTRQQKAATNILPAFQLTLFDKKIVLTELQTNVVANTFLGGILKHPLRIAGHTLLQLSNYTPREIYLSQLDSVSKLAAQSHSQPRFIFGHFLNAHPPYIFKPDGTQAPYNPDDNNIGAPRRDKYVNMVGFANVTAMQMIDTIKKSSKTQPIIIIQADEGPYLLQSPNQWQKASPTDLKLKLGILAAYDLPGVSSDKAQQINSSVDVFRFVFNNYFGTKLSYLPDCSYVYNNSQPFNFYNITPKLHGRPLGCP